MNLQRRNLIANFIGRGWAALMAIAFVPWYIHYLGIEAYGLVGLFATIQALSSLLDLGLSTAINHGIATLSARDGSQKEQRDLVRTLEILNWMIAVFIALLIGGLAPFIANHWLNTHGISADTASQAIQLMGLTLALRWPSNLYAGALAGLQRQLSVNLIAGGGATVANLGVIAILVWFSPTIEAFFTWQMLASAAQTFVVGWWIWHCLPERGHRARFSREMLARHWRFAAGMSGITALALLLTQTDKIILSRLLSLEQFGYYALASTVAGALLLFVQPIFAAAFPSFSAAVARRDLEALRRDYHRMSRLAACLIFPPAMVMVAFPGPLLWLWTGDPEIVREATPILSILALGFALNGALNVPYALQLAHGSTRLALHCNIVAVLVQLPLVIAGALLFGAPGAALGWPLLNLGYVALTAPIMHRRFLPGAQRTWALHDIGIPLALAAGVAVACLAAAPAAASRPAAMALLTIALTLSYAITLLGSRFASGRLGGLQ